MYLEMYVSNGLASMRSTPLLFFLSVLHEGSEFISQFHVAFIEPVQVRRLMCSMCQQFYVCMRSKGYAIATSTHDDTAAARTTADDHAPSKRLKVLPQLSSELWSDILRHRSMQIEVLRLEKLNRHRELGYWAVLR